MATMHSSTVWRIICTLTFDDAYFFQQALARALYIVSRRLDDSPRYDHCERGTPFDKDESRLLQYFPCVGHQRLHTHLCGLYAPRRSPWRYLWTSESFL